MGGMKEGAGSDPFADDADVDADAETDTSTDAGADPTPEAGAGTDTDPLSSTETDPSAATTGGAATSGQSRGQPYIHVRDKVKEGREDHPVPLRAYNRDRIADLQQAVEAELGEEVYKSDLLEAAIEHAIENPQDIAEMLETERYGYNWW